MSDASYAEREYPQDGGHEKEADGLYLNIKCPKIIFFLLLSKSKGCDILQIKVIKIRVWVDSGLIILWLIISKFDGWALIGAWIAIGTNTVLTN